MKPIDEAQENPTIIEIAKARAALDRLEHALREETHEGALDEAEWIVELARRIIDDIGPRTVVGRGRVLELANGVVKNREGTYGTPHASFTLIAELWSVLFGREVLVHEVPLALDLMKTARLMQSPTHLDSWVDKAGYAAIGAEATTGEAAR